MVGRAVAFTCCVATVAAAQAPDPEGSDAAPWSLGAQLGLNLVNVSAPAASQEPTPPTIPTATVSLERELTSRVSLLVGVSGSASTQSQTTPLTPSMPTTITNITDQEQVLVGAGARVQLLKPGSVIGFSVHAIGAFGYARAAVNVTEVFTGSPPMSSKFEITSMLFTVRLGMALEHRVADRIGVRLALDLLQGSYSTGQLQMDMQMMMTTPTGFSAGLVFQPALEVRFYF
jgi:hypothetical protein